VKGRRQRAARSADSAADAAAAPRRKLRWRILQRVVLHGLLFLSVLLLGMRALLSGLAGSHAEVALWLSEAFGLPASVGQVSGEWSGWSPAVAAEGVRLGDSRSGVGIGRIAVAIDPWASLQRRQVVPSRVSVSGLDLVLEENADGQILVKGLTPDPAPPSSPQDHAALLGILDRVQRLDLSVDRLVVRSPRLAQELVLAPIGVSIEGSGRERALHLEARVAASGGGVVRGRLQWPTTGGEASKLPWYAELEDFELDRLQAWVPGLPPGLSGNLSLQAWGEALAEAARGADERSADASNALAPLSTFRVQAGSLALGERLFDELLLSGRVHSGFSVAATQVEIDVDEARSPRGRWPDSTLVLALSGPLQTPEQLRLASGFLRLDDLSPLIAHLAGMHDTTLRGDLSQLRLRWQPTADGSLEGLDLRTEFSGVGLKLPAGWLETDRNEGRLSLNAGQGLLTLQARGLRLLAASGIGVEGVERAEGSVSFRLAEEGPRIGIHHLVLEHPALALGIDGRLHPLAPAGTDAAGTDAAGVAVAATDDEASADSAAVPALDADLTLRVFHGDLATLHTLLPAAPALAPARKWMQERLSGGRIAAGRGVLRGPLASWPWPNAEGHSELALQLEGAGIRFNPAWPLAEDIRADVVLRGSRLELTGYEARLLDVKMLSGTGVLEDVLAKERSLALDLALQATGPASKQLLNQSPLRNGPGRRLAKLNVKGLIDYRLRLDVPLFPGPVTEVDAEARFAGNDLDFGGELGLTKVEGSLPFTRDSWGGGPAAKALYEGLPVQVTAGSITDADGGGSRIALTGRAAPEFLEAQIARHAATVHTFMQRRAMWPLISGEAGFEAEIRIPPREAPADAETTLTITSTLEGMGLALPEPLAKSPEALSTLRLSTGLDAAPDERVIELRIGEAHSRIRLRRREADGPRLFAGAGLRLGDGVTEFPVGPVLALRGEVARLSLTEWEQLLTAGGEVSDEDPLDLDFDFRALELLALGQRFDDVRLIGRRDSGGWAVAVASEDADGRINWPREGGTASFDFSHLALETDPDAPASEDTSPKDLPTIIGSVADFSYAGNQLGRMRLSTAPLADGSGLELKELQFESERFRVNASGQWLASGRSQSSAFRINLEAPDLGQVLSSFGYTAAGIEGGRTRMVIDARWPGAPQAFRLDALSGEMELHLGKGRLLDVDPSAGRLFGLLSLQTLPRRLSLDFGDLFMEGFAFDRIDGTFRLDAGNAYTDDLTMVGPAAKVLVSGRTGLAARDYDQRVKVEPALSSSLPVAGALFGPVGIGVGAVLYLGQKVFRQIPGAIDSVIAQYYTVTGPWTEPVVQKQSAAERKADSG
jgi:uncharacterized protein (TIGR02099 family)